MAAKRDTDDSAVGSAPLGAGEQLAGERELWERFARDHEPAVREELVRRNMAFAKRLALLYRGASESFDDLLQVANLGLLNAIDRFEPERGIPFTAFAAPTILGELKRHFRDRVWTLRVPRGLQERIADIEEAITKLTGENGRSPSISEIGEKLGLDDAEVLEVFEASYSRRTLSLDQPVAISDESDETSVVERIGEEDARFEVVEDRTTIQDRLS